jgi:hypothetical protein
LVSKGQKQFSQFFAKEEKAFLAIFVDKKTRAAYTGFHTKEEKAIGTVFDTKFITILKKYDYQKNFCLFQQKVNFISLIKSKDQLFNPNSGKKIWLHHIFLNAIYIHAPLGCGFGEVMMISRYHLVQVPFAMVLLTLFQRFPLHCHLSRT